MLRLSSEQVERVHALTGADGVVTPDALVDDARDESSPLHSLFEWDDATAAERHRIDTARSIIRSVTYHVTYNRFTVAVPAYVHIGRSRERGYVRTDEVSERPDDALDTLRDEAARVLGMVERAQRVALGLGVAGVFDAVVREARLAQMRMAGPEMEQEVVEQSA